MHFLLSFQYRFKATCGTLPQQSNPRCTLKFGSWTYSENELSLRVTPPQIVLQFHPKAPATQGVGAQHSAKNGKFSIICTVMQCVCEHPN